MAHLIDTVKQSLSTSPDVTVIGVSDRNNYCYDSASTLSIRDSPASPRSATAVYV